MQLEYYSLPLSMERIMNRQEHPKTSLQQSVLQHLHLLVTTALGEFPADLEFGCSIWDHDFDNVTSAHKLKELIRQSLLQAIQRYEKRISNIRVELMILQEELHERSQGSSRVKKRIDISVNGTLQSTNERLNFKDSFFVGPLSY